MRIVAIGWATDTEICNDWSTAKLFDYNELLDVHEEAELKAAEARKDAADAAGS